MNLARRLNRIEQHRHSRPGRFCTACGHSDTDKIVIVPPGVATGGLNSILEQTQKPLPQCAVCGRSSVLVVPPPSRARIGGV